MGKVLKWIGIGFVIIIALAIIGSLGGDKDTTQPATSQPAQSQTEQKPAEQKKPDLEVIESKFEKDTFGGYIVGTVKNNTKKQYKYVQVEINLYDKDGNQVGSTMSNVNNLEPGATWKFKAPVIEEQAASFKIKEVTGF